MKNFIIKPDTNMAWLRLIVVFLLCAIGFIGMWSIVIILPSIQAEFKISRSMVTIPYVMTMLGFGTGNIIIGRYSDLYGMKKPIIYGFSFLTLLYFISLITPNIFTFAIIQFGLGFSSAVFFGPMMNDIGNFFVKRKGLAISIVASAQHFAGAFWPFLLAFLLIDQKWREAHLLIATLCLIFVPILCYIVFKINIDKKYIKNNFINEKNFTYKNISNKKFQNLLMIASIGCCVGMSTPQVHIIPLCIDKGYTLTTGGKILSVMLFCAVLSRIFFGYISDYIGPIKTLLIGSSLQAFTLILFIPFNSINGLFIVSALFGLSQGGIVPSYALIVKKYLPEKDAAERIGLIIFCTIIGMSIGGWISGKIFDYFNSYMLGFLNSVLWNIINISIITYIFLIIRKGQLVEK